MKTAHLLVTALIALAATTAQAGTPKDRTVVKRVAGLPGWRERITTETRRDGVRTQRHDSYPPSGRAHSHTTTTKRGVERIRWNNGALTIIRKWTRGPISFFYWHSRSPGEKGLTSIEVHRTSDPARLHAVKVKRVGDTPLETKHLGNVDDALAKMAGVARAILERPREQRRTR